MHTSSRTPLVTIDRSENYIRTYVLFEDESGDPELQQLFTFHEQPATIPSNYRKVVTFNREACEEFLRGNFLPIMEAWMLFCSEHDHVDCDEWDVDSNDAGVLVLSTGDWILDSPGRMPATQINHRDYIESVPTWHAANYDIAEVDGVPRGVMHNQPGVEYNTLELFGKMAGPQQPGMWFFGRSERIGSYLYGQITNVQAIILKVTGRFTYGEIWNTLHAASPEHAATREDGTPYFGPKVHVAFTAEAVYDADHETLGNHIFYGHVLMVATDEQAETKIQQLVQDIMNTTTESPVAASLAVDVDVIDATQAAPAAVINIPNFGRPNDLVDSTPVYYQSAEILVTNDGASSDPAPVAVEGGDDATTIPTGFHQLTSDARRMEHQDAQAEAPVAVVDGNFAVAVDSVVHDDAMVVGTHKVNVAELLTHGVGSRAPKPNRQREQRRKDAGTPPAAHRNEPRPRPARPQVPAIQQSPLAAQYLANIKVPEDSKDGEGHLNVGTSGKTQLGRFLDINAQAEFVYGDLGRFNSLGGVWVFICCDEEMRATDIESIRMLHGTRARSWSRNCTKQVDGFKIIMADATMVKILSNPQRAEELAASTLPLRMYHANGEDGQAAGLNVNAAWYVPVLEEIRRMLVARKETGDNTIMPDFSFLNYNGGAIEHSRRNANRNRPAGNGNNQQQQRRRN